MTVTLVDTAKGLREVLAAPPAGRAEVLRRLLAPMEGMFRYFPGEVDLVQMHAISLGFPLDRCQDEVADGLTRLQDADAWGRIEGALTHGIEVQNSATPGGPHSEHHGPAHARRPGR